MDIPPLLIQSALSLLAIFALFIVARGLKLGGKPRLSDASAARNAAEEVVDGFAATRVSIDRSGTAALARNEDGHIMIIKRHGNRFAGRVLSDAARVREEVDGLVVDVGETQFGAVRLSLEDPGYWADAINRL